jgi:hypothetical protein
MSGAGRTLSRRALLGGAAAVLACAATPLRACGFDGALDAGFGYVHPRSFEVALAVRQAVADGVLAREALAPLQPGAQGLWAATGELKRFGAALSAALAPDGRLAIALLLANAALWTRFTPQPDSFGVEVHAAGPAKDDIVVVTDLAVVAALASGRLAGGEALARRLAVIDADAAANAKIAMLFAGLAPGPAEALAFRSAWPGRRQPGPGAKL